MSKTITKLLARGGRTLATACVAYSKENSEIKWNVLSPQIVRATTQIINELKNTDDPNVLAAAVKACMLKGPSTAAAAWTKRFWNDELLLEQLGGQIDFYWPPGQKNDFNLTNKQKGLAALAIALCRSIDASMAVAHKLSDSAGKQLIEMSYLASVLVEPGEPSKMKKKISNLILDNQNG